MEKYSVNQLISWRIIDGQILILDSHLNESAHELNEIGSFIFSQISQGKELDSIKKDLKETYPEEAEIEEDMQHFIDKLKELQLIVPTP